MRVLVQGRPDSLAFTFRSVCWRKAGKVFGIDNLNDYYDVNLKKDRLGATSASAKIHFQQVDLADGRNLARFVADSEPEVS